MVAARPIELGIGPESESEWASSSRCIPGPPRLEAAGPSRRGAGRSHPPPDEGRPPPRGGERPECLCPAAWDSVPVDSLSGTPIPRTSGIAARGRSRAGSVGGAPAAVGAAGARALVRSARALVGSTRASVTTCPGSPSRAGVGRGARARAQPEEVTPPAGRPRPPALPAPRLRRSYLGTRSSLGSRRVRSPPETLLQRAPPGSRAPARPAPVPRLPAARVPELRGPWDVPSPLLPSGITNRSLRAARWQGRQYPRRAQAPESFWSGRLHVHGACRRRAEPLHHDLTRRADPWRLADHGAVGVREPQTGAHDKRRHVCKQREAVGPGPPLVGVGKVGAEVSESAAARASRLPRRVRRRRRRCDP